MNLMTAHREWRERPHDQRYQSFDALQAAVDARKHASYEVTSPTSLLRVGADESGDLRLHAGGMSARFSNWSFNQFASRIGVPAEFVSSLPAHLATDVINHRIQAEADRSDDKNAKLLFGDNGHGGLVLRAATSDRYARTLWDSDAVSLVQKLISGTSFHNPLAFKDGRFGGEVEPGGLYASDRDVFMTVWDDQNAIEVDGEQLFRFALFWNSETGARTFGVTLGLVRTICRNLILWGARDLTQFAVRHIGAKFDQRVQEQIPRILDELGVEDPKKEREVIRAALRHQVARNDDEAIKFLREKTSLGLKVSTEAVKAAVAEEGGSGTLWQVVQGITAHARSINNRDKRLLLEREAGKLLDLVAA